MYKRTSKFKYIWIIISSIILILFICYEIKAEKNRCMGIPFITEEELQTIPLQPVELGNIVLLEDHLVAFEEEARTIYLPCTVTADTKFYELEGQLKSALPEYDLYFLWDNIFGILEDAVKYSYSFTLYAIDEEGHYTTYPVIFTKLPVLELRGEASYIDERARDVYAGEMYIWEPKSEETGMLRVQNSRLEWHTRGFSSASLPMPPLKLNLLEKSGEQNNLSMLGFESDDDYLLNPMGLDDVMVRERLAMDLWNEMADLKGSSLKMSEGKYCELIINGEYLGVRLVQNKIEKGYLKLDEDDILLKGKNVNRGTKKPPEEVYEMIYSNQDQEITYQTISKFFYETDFSSVNLDSWVDLQLLLQLGNMIDNELYKNIYYVIQRDNGKDVLSFIPWDTDMSFGIYWSDGFKFLPETVQNVSNRLEYNSLVAQYPQVEELLAKRWKELRITVFSEENIIKKIDAYYGELYASGALHRDFNVLGWYAWGGNDTVDGLKTYIQERLLILDEKYK